MTCTLESGALDPPTITPLVELESAPLYPVDIEELPKSDAFPVDAKVTKSISLELPGIDLFENIPLTADAHPALPVDAVCKLPKSSEFPNV